MEWLRTQITMTEVNVARVHNFAVLKREQARAVSGSGAPSNTQSRRREISRTTATLPPLPAAPSNQK